MGTKTVYEWLNTCENVNWNRAGCILILKDGEIVGKIKIAFPKDGAGTLRLFLWDFENNIQMGTAGGFGYDKLSAAMRGLTFKDITFTDHPHNWEMQLRDAGYTTFTAM